MIGKISGRLDHRAADHVLIDTGGVGYVVFCSERTLAAMPAPGGVVALYTDLLVREDLLQLFGFRTLGRTRMAPAAADRAGGGRQGGAGDPRHARDRGRGAGAVARRRRRDPGGAGHRPEDRPAGGAGAAGQGADGDGDGGLGRGAGAGVGRQTRRHLGRDAGGARRRTAIPAAGAQDQADALSALVNLGYAPGEAAAAIADAGAEATDTADLIRAALRALAPKG